MIKILKWIKSLFTCKKPVQKKVLEKIDIVRPIKKKHYPAGKKCKKGKKCQK